ncbi:MAG: endonuclease/exonuclease/phosphatase family protein [Gammaproteobacteria bacterium]|nr:endonuclease/exonuclease/phosphatase family protein [Gammaproteobacteria bacterium]
MINVLTRLAVAAVAATTLATAAALGARAGWLLELFSHFTVQYLCLQLLAAAACLALRRWPWALAAAVAAIPNLLAVGPYLPGLISPPAGNPAGIGAARTPIRLVAANLLYLREDGTAARAYLEAKSADLVVLSEFTPRWREELRGLERAYPYFALRTRRNAWGIAVYSKHPLLAIEDLDLGDDTSSQLRVLVELPDGLAEVYAVHLASPVTPRRAARRNTQLRRLAERIAAGDAVMPRIAAGDFNTTPYSPYFQDLLRDARLSDGRRPFGLHVTWPAWPVPLWIPIDHCLAGGPLTVTRVATGPPIGSDHLPLECTFTL